MWSRGPCRHRTRNCQLVPGVDGDVDGAGRGGGEAQPQPVGFDLTVLRQVHPQPRQRRGRVHRPSP